MKKTLYVLLWTLAMMPSGIHAQQAFAPVGAEWWYHDISIPFWVQPPGGSLATEARFSYHTRSVADTVVAGISCRKVTTDFRVKFNASSNFGFYFGPVKDLYFYDNTDTVFIYNDNFGRFTPMYVYNAQEGDTVCLPVLPSPTPDLRINPFTGDTSFCFIIDSIRVLTYDTAHLRTFYTRALSQQGSGSNSMGTEYPAYNWASGNPSIWVPGSYTERIAGVSFFPFRILYCADCAEYPYGPYGSLACYSDSAYNIHLRTAIPCDSLLDPSPLSINDPDLSDDNIVVYPVPGREQCTLGFRHPLSAAATVQLSDLTGRSLGIWEMQRGASKLSINTAALSGGVYLLQIRKDHAAGYRKLVIAH